MRWGIIQGTGSEEQLQVQGELYFEMIGDSSGGKEEESSRVGNDGMKYRTFSKRQKLNYYSEENRSLLRWNKKHFAYGSFILTFNAEYINAYILILLTWP